MKKYPLLFSIMFIFLSCSEKESIEIRLSFILSHSEETINLAQQELKAGHSFTEVVEKYSSGPNKDHGGDIGFIREDALRKNLQDEAAKLEIGEYSDIIRSEDEYYILMKTDERIVSVPFEQHKFLITIKCIEQWSNSYTIPSKYKFILFTIPKCNRKLTI